MHTTGQPPGPHRPPTASQRTATAIRAIMGAKRLGNADMAQALDIGEKAASRRRQGRHDFKLNEIEEIAAWLEVPVESLTTPVDPASAAPLVALRTA